MQTSPQKLRRFVRNSGTNAYGSIREEENLARVSPPLHFSFGVLDAPLIPTSFLAPSPVPPNSSRTCPLACPISVLFFDYLLSRKPPNQSR
jgi:hypothetical protein